MPAGQPRKPTALKKLQGNPGKRAMSKDEPMPEVELPPVPKDLNATARAEWKRIALVLFNVRVLTRADLATLRSYCVNFSLAYDAEQIIAIEGIIIEETRGGQYSYTVEKEHPAVGVFMKADRQMKESARELGLTPAARVKVHTVPAGNSSPLDALRAKLKGIRGGKR